MKSVDIERALVDVGNVLFNNSNLSISQIKDVKATLRRVWNKK